MQLCGREHPPEFAIGPGRTRPYPAHYSRCWLHHELNRQRPPELHFRE